MDRSDDIAQYDRDMKDAGFLGSGWSFPPTFSMGNHQLTMTSQQRNINQSIDLILNTRCGDRSLDPDFGTRLHTLVFTNYNRMVHDEIIDTVTSALRSFEPRIKVLQVTVVPRDAAETQIDITVDYLIKNTNTRHNHVYPFALNEATQLNVNREGV